MYERFERNARVLIYSHDSFGLGHLSRCRAIAHSLVDHRPDISVLILSGLPIIGSYPFRPRVDFVRFPGVVKLKNGSYTARGLDVSIEDAIELRQSIIRCAAETFRPDVFLVDKEPLGLRGEVESTLVMLKSRGTRLVLGLRDIMDGPDILKSEWDRKDAVPALVDLYDDILVYGCEAIYDPLLGIEMPRSVTNKMTYTGYLRRSGADDVEAGPSAAKAEPSPYVLVTTGGGGDGAELIEWVMRAYEADAGIPYRAEIVLGPFMANDDQQRFRSRAAALGEGRVTITTFVNDLAQLMRGSVGVVGMGGYNTFCEILTHDKPSLIVPRTVPRLEQFIRASRMEELGLVRMLVDDGRSDPQVMAGAIRGLAGAPPPSKARIAGLLDGFDVINGLVDGWLDRALGGRTLRIVGGND
ncbi:MAG: hypothetical protein R3D33_18680 [Hyphomicrobiaceae bacterium]